jgi:uncharacterized membrane protein
MLSIHELLAFIRICIGAIGVVVICFGALRAVYQLVMLCIAHRFSENYIRLQFGDSVILGLEFMVAADIVGSLVAPDYYNLGLLAVIVIIRTILSYFLTLELQGLTPGQREKIK